MEFRIADTFTDSLARLTADEQKAVKTTAFDLQMNPTNPGMSFHKLDRARDKSFWSVRVNSDLRLIVHKTQGSLLLCYVDHHDKAYDWAERRKLETHPATGAAQLVEIRETVREVVVSVYVQAAPAGAQEPSARKPVLGNRTTEELLSYGVPQEWLADVMAADEDTLLTVADHLPAEAAEAVLELATGGKPRITQAFLAGNPFEHPDAHRRFRVMSNVEELERALEFPWEKWAVFLHPDQRQWVQGNYAGPARVSGSAGTGKTIVALHRAAHLARANPDARVLLTTFSDALANALHAKLRALVFKEPRLIDRIDVYSLEGIGRRLYKTHAGSEVVASREVVVDLITQAAAAVGGHSFGPAFLRSEWEHVVDAWQLTSWSDYRDVARLGRKTRLPERQRAVIWAIFERVKSGIADLKYVTQPELFTSLARILSKLPSPIFDFAVVDEAQDLGIAHLRFLAALAGGRPNALFFAGDLGQRIFQHPFSWRGLGIDVRGRSRTLRVNYRTSHQIRIQADRLLDREVTDADGNAEDRSATISVFNGPAPSVRALGGEEAEIRAVSEWIAQRTAGGLRPAELGVFVRSPAQLYRARAAVEAAGLPFRVLDDRVESSPEHVSISTMHLAKGLEFRAVAVMACDDSVIPSQDRIGAVGDEGDLDEVYATERQLLYVACTRARDHLLVTSAHSASEFLDDMRS